MIREYYQKLCEGEEVRANLIALKEALKEPKNVRAFAYLLGGDFSVLTELLKAEDPKIRKNAALLLGKMESEDLLPVLFDAYQKESTRFIRADYLKAIARMDYKDLLEDLTKRMEELRSAEILPEEQKHTAEELRMLQSMVLRYQSESAHRFTAFHQKEWVILVTNREQAEVTLKQLPAGKGTLLRGGVRVDNLEIGTILPIRTYTELLFPLDTKQLPVDDPQTVGEYLAECEQERSLTSCMKRMHEGSGAYRFRIELKSRLEASKKGNYIRKISDALERCSKGRWINSINDYETEIRLIERKDGTFLAMLKLYTIPDKRFLYRKEVVASSIAPVNAALTAALAKPYLKEDAVILDPFCGVGTMLIERTKLVPAKAMYGLDIFGKAIEYARENTAYAGCRANYINRDFFTFEHEHLFDEVITDLPQVTQSKQKAEIHALYLNFFAKAKEHLNDGAVLILYATEPQYVAEAVRRDPQYKIEETYLLNEKNRTTVYIVRYN